MRRAVPFDFRRPDRIPKSQLRAIYLLHDSFVHNLVVSLSAYLRSYVMVSLVSVEQLSYAEFLECLPTPTCAASLTVLPYDGNAIMEINSSLVFPIIETLLGGSGKRASDIRREVTDIELTLLDGLFRVILRDLSEAWKGVAAIAFNVESLEKDPKHLKILTPGEAVVAIGVEIRIGDIIGMMNIAIPSIIIKMTRQKFDQQWGVRKTEPTTQEQSRVLNLILPSKLSLDARLEGPTLLLEDLLRLEEGDVLGLEYPVEDPIGFRINGKLKFSGRVVAKGQKMAFVIEKRAPGNANLKTSVSVTAS